MLCQELVLSSREVAMSLSEEVQLPGSSRTSTVPGDQRVDRHRLCSGAEGRGALEDQQGNGASGKATGHALQ